MLLFSAEHDDRNNIKTSTFFCMVYQDGQKHRYGSTHISKLRVDVTYFCGSTRKYIRVDPYFTGLLAYTGRPVFLMGVMVFSRP